MNCEHCEEAFDLNIHRPKILINCGHTLCQSCLNEIQDDTDEDTFCCPFDDTQYTVGQNFMDNMILIKPLKQQRKVSGGWML
jgi:hypothetical protein